MEYPKVTGKIKQLICANAMNEEDSIVKTAQLKIKNLRQQLNRAVRFAAPHSSRCAKLITANYNSASVIENGGPIIHET